MSEALQTWQPPTFEDSSSAISSPALECGVTPSDSQALPMTDLFGQAVALAPVSAPQEKAKGLQTLVTSGHIGYASSASAALQASLESRLRQQLDTAGSTLFTLTWKRRRTPLGRSYLERAASVRRTSDNDCISVAKSNRDAIRERGGLPARPWAYRSSIDTDRRRYPRSQSLSPRLEGHFGHVRDWRGPGWLDPHTARSVAEAGATRGFWADCRLVARPRRKVPAN